MSENGVGLAYGRDRLRVRLNPAMAEWNVINPGYEAPLPNAEQVFAAACAKPNGAPPLADLIAPDDHVMIITSDGTRPVPNRLLIPWILEQLPVPVKQVSVLLGNGSHRPNTDEELDEMFGPELARDLEIINHSAYEAGDLVDLGTTRRGGPIRVNKRYLQASKRIVVGFIEPHFFAGFSGGPKGIIPGLAGIDTILHLHNYELIADPNSTFGILEDNPIQNEICEMVAACPPEFLVNVSLNLDKQITGIYAGDYIQAHRAGSQQVLQSAMAAVPEAYPLVITTNSGFPLDQNLYQSVKGMVAAAQITQPGGTILIASECSDGVPMHGNFFDILQKGESAEDILQWIRDLPEPILDQWEAQVLCKVLQRHHIELFSTLDPQTVESCPLQPVEDIEASIENHLGDLGNGAKAAVLPEGPQTIPYVSTAD